MAQVFYFHPLQAYQPKGFIALVPFQRRALPFNLILNGGFDDTSAWTLGSGCTISGSKLNATAAGQICQQPVTYISGHTYQIDFDYTCTSGSKLRINLNVSNGANIVVTSGALITDGSTQHLTLTFVSNVTTDYTSIEADSATFTGTIDSVSAKEVVSVVNDTAVVPSTGHLIFTGYQPAITTINAISPSTADLVFGGKVPTVSLTVAIAPATGHLTFGGKTPTISVGTLVNPLTGHLTFVGYTPALTFTTGVSPSTGHLSFGGKISSVALNVNLTPTTGHLAFSGKTPTLAFGITPLTGHLVFTGYVPDVSGASVVSSALPLKVQYRHRGRNC